MAKCEMCDREMKTADSCIGHFVRLQDGQLVPEPEHTELTSAGSGDGQCHDCGVSPGAIHHTHCDSARLPSGGQILSVAEEYLHPDDVGDGEEATRYMVFDLWDEDDREALAAFRTLLWDVGAEVQESCVRNPISDLDQQEWEEGTERALYEWLDRAPRSADELSAE